MSNSFLLKKYQSRFIEFGDTPQGLFWNDRLTQNLRFSRIYHAMKPYLGDVPSICDIGCGTSDFSQFLVENDQPHNYIGIDIVPEMIHTCKNKFPQNEYLTANFLEMNSPVSADFLVLSGSLNMRDQSSTWEDTCYRTLDKMYSSCRNGIVFNFLTGYSDFKSSDLIYFQPEDIFSYCMKNMSRFVQIDHAYPLYEATVMVLKQGTVEGNYPQTSLKKYFKK